MANFQIKGKRVSCQTVSVATHETLKLELYGPIDYDGTKEELQVAFESPTNVATVARSAKAIQNRIRIWEVVGKAAGTAKLNAKLGDAVWDWVMIGVFYSPEDAFVAKLAKDGADVAKKYKLPVSLMIAQSCLESGYGRSDHAKSNNVLYGITKRSELSLGKEHDWYPACGTIVPLPTRAIAGHKVVMDRFCSASSYEHAVEIWAQYVTQHPHSKSVANLFKGPPWTRSEIQTLANHMSTSLGFGVGVANYGQEVLNLIDKYNLTQYD